MRVFRDSYRDRNGTRRRSTRGTRRADGLSIATSNHYVTAVKGFFRWLQRESLMAQSPVAHLSKLNANSDLRHVWRSLGIGAFRHLLAVTCDELVRFGMTGRERMLVYRLAFESGLRANQWRTLSKAGFALTGDEPTMTIKAGYSKRRRENVQPLRPDTAAEL